MESLKTLIKFGNAKLPKSTAVFNLTSATDCPSLKKGMCQAYYDGKCVCYALKAERMYPLVLPYRCRQAEYWAKTPAKQFLRDFLAIVSRKRIKVTALRLNESGDFRRQHDVYKAEEIAKHLFWWGITVYCYTARADLDYSKCEALRVRASGYEPRPGQIGTFAMVEKDAPKNGYRCPGDCKKCSVCMISKSVPVIEIVRH